MPFNSSPHLLGVHLGCTLLFIYQVEITCKNASSQCRVLACLASKDWGWRKRQLKKIYISLIQSCIDFADAAWQSWLSSTKFQVLEATQIKALCIMTGQAKTTPVEALRGEARLCSCRTVSNRLCVRGYKKAARLQVSHPKNMPLCSSVQQTAKVHLEEAGYSSSCYSSI